ncbi:hypothetical protein J9253_10850 [Thiothrix litoralis]|uniref:DUF3757 domain-containing protein n=1 Tax=Thiothrix litoralis TaxID=2891210 RepID=A0ABX7WUF1_9GAMM|nr:STY0301 family protein [Thiothrix litoralis]QTR44550.1 hypothetical protein J9253_10850 [Thiothrix litoralis]
MNKKWLLLTIASMFSAGVAADDYTCPLSLDIQAKLVSEPADWSGMYEKSSGEIVTADGNEIRDTVDLVEIALYAGEPKDQAPLEPDNADSLAEEGGDSLWSFGSVAEQNKNPLYVACHYEGSSMGVFKKMTAPVKSCTWHFTPDAANNVLTCTPEKPS